MQLTHFRPLLGVVVTFRRAFIYLRNSVETEVPRGRARG